MAREWTARTPIFTSTAVPCNVISLKVVADRALTAVGLAADHCLIVNSRHTQAILFGHAGECRELWDGNSEEHSRASTGLITGASHR